MVGVIGCVGHDDFGELLLAFRRDVEAGAGLSFGRTRDVARVLDREEALRDRHEGIDAQREGREGHEQHRQAELQHEIEHVAVAGGDAVDHKVDRTGKQAGPRMMIDRLQQACAEHWRQRQRHKTRHEDRARDCHREFTEHAPDDAAHHQHRDEHGDERQCDRQNGEADFARALQGRLERRHSIFDMTHDIFEHHDGVIDHEAHRQRDREQRDVVDRIAESVHERTGADQRHRQRQRRNERRGDRLQEHEDDEHHEGDRKR